jgi:hypothetical protein
MGWPRVEYYLAYPQERQGRNSAGGKQRRFQYVEPEANKSHNLALSAQRQEKNGSQEDDSRRGDRLAEDTRPQQPRMIRNSDHGFADIVGHDQ